jgi:opacity protein-like surface antigen
MKHFLGIALLCSVASSLSFSAQAEHNFYGILAAGYVQNEVEEYELDKASYKIGVGYELNPQWYIEAGYQALGEENASADFADIDADKAEFSGMYLSVLGKAQGEYGELFYRLGAMRIDADVESVSDLSCTPTIPSDPNIPASCRFDESLIAGVAGLGFDFYIHNSLMMRFEAEYIKGEKDYAATAAYVGLRYNF